MDRESELIDLGTVGEDTKGASLNIVDDEEGGFRPKYGLSDD